MDNIDYTFIKTEYDRDGYIFIPDFLSGEEVKNINKEIENFIKVKVSAMPSNNVFYENNDDPDSLKQLQDIHKYDPFFTTILEGSKFEKMAKVLLRENVIAKNLEYFNKPPRIGKPTPPHQDNYYFMLNPPQALTMWLALENIDEENGCVRYIKASHLNGMRLHGRAETLGFSQGIIDYNDEDSAKEVPMSAKPGDLLIHHSMAIHRAM